MARKRIMLTEQEYKQLSRILNSMKENRRLNLPHLQTLYEEVGDAVIMEESEFPSGFVTLNSKVRYTNLEDFTERTVRLVFPADADKEERNCSIFTPLGAALIGENPGSISICNAPGGLIPLRIEAICHPEYQVLKE